MKILLVSHFKELSINIYGTCDEPFFDIKDVNKIVHELTKTKGDIVWKGHNLLSKFDVFTLLSTLSNNLIPYIATQLQHWFLSVLTEINEHKQKQNSYEEIAKDGHIYVIQTDGGTKVGKTKGTVSKRIKGLQTANVNDIQILLDFKTSNSDLLEKCVHYALDRYRCNSNREFFECDIEYIKNAVCVIGSIIDVVKSSYHNIPKEVFKEKLLTSLENSLQSTTKEKHSFVEWMNKNIVYKKNHILKLSQVCESYFGNKVGPRVMNAYKYYIEHWIKNNYPSFNHVYKISSLNNISYKGWLHFDILSQS